MTRWEGENNPRWAGGRNITSYGNVMVIDSTHPRANKNGRVFEHILIAEKALGRYLPDGAVVHHINGVRHDNRPENLLICQDELYHKFLHRRKRAFEACGHVDWIKCQYCGEYDAPENLYVWKKKDSVAYHRKCATEYNKKWFSKKHIT